MSELQPGKPVITLPSQDEASALAREEGLRAALEASGIGTWNWDVGADRVEWDPAVARLFGVAPDRAPRTVAEFVAMIHPDDRDRVAAECSLCLDDIPVNFEYRVVLPDGEVRWLHTRARTLAFRNGRPSRIAGAVIDVTARRLAEAARDESEERLRLAIRTTGIGTWDYDPATRIRRWSDEFKTILGLPGDAEPYEGLFAGLLHPDDRDRTMDLFHTTLAAGGPGRYSVECRIRRQGDGTERWLAMEGRAFFDGAGRPLRAIGTVMDITERKRAEDHQKLLMAELNHRVKNTLATVQSIAGQTLRNAGSPEAFAAAFTGRLLALSGAHDLLTEGAWQGASLADLVRRTLAPYLGGEAGRVTMGGPPVLLSPNAAVTLNMAFHELATNAAKYGALSVPPGRVAVAWQRVGETLEIHWSERGGPPAAVPDRRGFGSRLIERGVGQELNAEVQLDFPPEGAQCRMKIPASHKVMVR